MMTEVITAIQSVGFPIVAALGCGFYVRDREEKNDARIDRLTEQHREEIAELNDKLAAAINNNTLVMQRLLDKMED